MILVRFFMTGGNTEIGAVCFGGSVEGDFRFPVSGFRRRQSGHDHPESSHIDRSPVAINRNSVAINRNSVTINRNPVTINRNSVTINRNPVTINRNSITINRNPVTINRNLVSINRNVVSINRNPVSINRNPVSINRNPVTINRSLVSINWNLVSINRNSVSIDWNPVTFDRGQTFVLHGQRRSDPGCTPEACGRLAGRKRRRRAATGFGCNRDWHPGGVPLWWLRRDPCRGRGGGRIFIRWRRAFGTCHRLISDTPPACNPQALANTAQSIHSRIRLGDEAKFTSAKDLRPWRQSRVTSGRRSPGRRRSTRRLSRR
jgi:hypothetical protein